MVKIKDQVGLVLANTANLSNQDPITISSLIREYNCNNHTDCNDPSVGLEDDVCNYLQNNTKIRTLARVWGPDANVAKDASSSQERAQVNDI